MCEGRELSRTEEPDIGTESEPQELLVRWKDENVEVCVLQIYRDKPSLGLNLVHDDGNSEHLEPEPPQRLIQVPEIYYWTQPPSFLGTTK